MDHKIADNHVNHPSDPEYYHMCDLDGMDRDHCKFEFKTIVKNNQEEFQNVLNSLDPETLEIIHISTLNGDDGIIWTGIVKHIKEHCSCSRACNLCENIVSETKNETARIEYTQSNTDILSLAKECEEELIREGFTINSKTNTAEVKEIKERYGILMIKAGANNNDVSGLLKVSPNTVPAWKRKADQS